MSHKDDLRSLLEPLGVYDLVGRYNGGELDSQGMALDGVGATLDENHREADLTTAESWGLEAMASLLLRRPVTTSPSRLRTSLAALLRMGGDSFTLEAINDTILGCGVWAKVSETGEVGKVEVSFPEVPGIPKGFEEISKIIEDILPAHLVVEYVYWYVTWEQLEAQISCWQDFEDRALTWEQVETLVTDIEE